ncbi:MAG: methyltransferase [Planctomycetia bacterium]|nr:methyltransferase [Planctomycetia bacterium]
MVDCVRRSAFAARLLFGVKIRSERRIAWDFTTLVLRRSLIHRTRAGRRVLEIGTGPHAILSIFLAKRRRPVITACDINPVYVSTACEAIKRNSVQVSIFQSDLLERVGGLFDLIFFNSVYIPRPTGEKLRLDRSHQYDSDWCGGETGTETIARFLDQCHAHLAAGGEILLGFNTVYLPESGVAALCREHRYRVVTTGRTFLNPSRVLVLQRRDGR